MYGPGCLGLPRIMIIFTPGGTVVLSFHSRLDAAGASSLSMMICISAARRLLPNSSRPLQTVRATLRARRVEIKWFRINTLLILGENAEPAIRCEYTQCR